MEYLFVPLLQAGRMACLLLFLFLIPAGLCSVEENLLTEDGDLFQGDIKLTIDQKFELLSGSWRGKNSITSKLWPGGVLVYHIAPSLAKDMKALCAIWRAMKEYEHTTCIRFKKRTNEEAYVSLFRGGGCWSYIGRTGSKQLLSLAPDCWRHGTVVHEIAHSLGCFHEHSRLDRDEYVTIKWRSIWEEEKYNFKKQLTSLDSLGTRYDFNSVMHYGPRFFSKNGLPTIVAKKPWINIGQRVGLSPMDAIKINLLYRKQCKVHTVPPVISTSKPSTRRPSPPLPRECGASPVGRVIGGEDAKLGNWPWQVGLYMSGQFICGGSLVSPTWVLTAAHCITNNEPTEYFVRLGDNDRDKNEGSEQKIKIKRIQRHPKYNKKLLNNDIALLELGKPAILNKQVGLVCLPPQEYDVPVKSDCYITGWGKIKHTGSAHPILQQANMSPISQADCKIKNNIPGIQITPEMLCAGQPGSNVSGCHGDSGGPYVCQNDFGRWVLQGVVSWGSGKCDAKSLFTVFARVAKFRTWVDSYIRFNPASPPPSTTKQTTSPTTATPSVPPPPPPIPSNIPPTAKPPSCGLRNSHSRIVGGTEAPKNSWPWQVMLRDSSSGNQFCGGSLVHPFWVITAAHCVEGGSLSSFSVRLGAHYRTKASIGTEQDVKVAVIVPHPSYNKPVHYANDIALLKLAKPARLGKGIGLACLANNEYELPMDSNSKCYITGWGTLSSGGSQPNVLMQASVPLVSKQRCLIGYPGRIDDSMLCAGLDKGGVDACQGDSGGPLVCEHRHIWYLEGATSWGWGCAQAGKYGVYAKVRHFRKWLLDTMKNSPAVTATPPVPPPVPPPPPIPSNIPSISTTPPVPPPPPIPSKIPSTAKPPSCGLRNSHSRIVGGTEAPKNSWPWQVMLRDSSSGNQFCGGSLVHPFWVITAAHCVEGESLSSFSVRLGAHYRTKASIGTEQDVKVAVIVPHPSYNKPVHYANDIALLKLAKPARLGKGIGLACLANNEYELPMDSNSKCYITGWGTLSSGGSQPNVLMQASVPLVSKQRCLIGYPGRIDDSMLCAGLDKGGVDACQGDSGGPLVCEHRHIWYLEGTTSWGWGCAQAGKYGVYAKVRHFRKWLLDTMKISPPVTGPVSTLKPSVTPTAPKGPVSVSKPSVSATTPPGTVSTTEPSTIPTIPRECTHYNFINESDRAITNSNRQFKCDITLTSGWYRFHGQAGQQMPTSCVEINHCGANAPGWINGTHPSVAEGVSTVQVCFNWGHKCCRYSTNIRVRNCSGFYVYELKKTPGCRLRYCGNGTQGPDITQTPSAIPSTTSLVPSAHCGISAKSSRVIGGGDAQVGHWPWQVALLKGSYKSFSCGGSLIAADWVVTAAHCITAGKPGSYYTIRVGDFNRLVIEGKEQDIPGKRVITHPEYNTPSPLNNDIALVQLSRPASQNARVGIVCLPAADEPVSPEANCFITGWGKITHSGSAHSILQEAELPPVNNSECASKLAASPGGTSLKITPQMLCAGRRDSNVGGCHGDSGGPYVCQESDKRWVLQGAVSWGSPTCSAYERYTVFVRIAKFRNWIDTVMN